MIKACFFDLDGTLQDSEILWVEAVRCYLNDRGAGVSTDTAMGIVYGRGWNEIFTDMARLVPALVYEGLNATTEAIRDYYQRQRSTTSIALPGSIALLRRLAQSMPVAIVSGSTRHDIKDSIDYLGIGDAVDFYVGAEDYPFGKPAPDCFLLAADRLGLEPERCLVFEDSTVGVIAAKAAGMYCVALAVPGRPAQQVDGADLVLADLGGFELADLVG
ncbi:MAG: HAD family phosphatase [Lentisphaerae bacterium]|jgi:HAD superfamily hydrolase (TIGR01509 family)|nr:HAD family phosphatase [Lentisphaerota bacterium]